jgi:hypothetical protein
MRRAVIGWGESQDGWCARNAGRYDEGRLPYGFKRRKTNLSSGQPILMVERLGGVRGAARVKPNLRHGEFLLPPGSTLDGIFFFSVSSALPFWLVICCGCGSWWSS